MRVRVSKRGSQLVERKNLSVPKGVWKGCLLFYMTVVALGRTMGVKMG